MIKLKSNLYSKSGEIIREIDLPKVFETVPREDLIRKAFRSSTLSRRQPFGSYTFSGMRRVGHNLGPNHGISRIPRIAGGSRGVINASMVGGRSAHSPRNTKNLTIRINRNERRLALKSAISMTAVKSAVTARGHKLSSEVQLPIVVEDAVADITRTRDALALLSQMGIAEDIERAKEGVRIRAGRGKMRGRKYKKPLSVLVVGTDKESLRPFGKISGVEIADVRSMSIRRLAPGGVGGRLTLFTEGALKAMGETE
ncbi:MAG: 50S ribosomal protein L4 [Candidatus Thermoplasmatota archaeon]|nr:50S ribosomal protein L4 [Candidatus Thermoplasmatota archaeon]